jgi:hypothetical protein
MIRILYQGSTFTGSVSPKRWAARLGRDRAIINGNVGSKPFGSDSVIECSAAKGHGSAGDKVTISLADLKPFWKVLGARVGEVSDIEGEYGCLPIQADGET